MNAQTYLQTALETSSHYEMSPHDNELLTKEGIEGYIYNKLTSKKFRKFKMTESSVTHTKQAIQKLVKNDVKIKRFWILKAGENIS